MSADMSLPLTQRKAKRLARLQGRRRNLTEQIRLYEEVSGSAPKRLWIELANVRGKIVALDPRGLDEQQIGEIHNV